MNRAKAEGITFTKEPYIEDVGPRRIKSMKFSTLSESEIGKIAEVQVWKGHYYDSFRKPIPGGLLDPSMGPANKSLVCATCHGNFNDCPGHYGYLTLALPVYNVGYLGTIVEILKCICKSCARILLNEDSHKEWLKKMNNPKMEADMKVDLAKKLIAKCNKVMKCPRCGYINGSVKKAVSAIKIIHDRSKCKDSSVEEYQSALSHTREPRATINSDTLSPSEVLTLFKRMHDEDCALLYLAERPEKLIITNIAVPPIAIRPSVIMDGSQSNENDITERLKLIIQANAVLRQEVESSGSGKSLDGLEMLQAEVARFINSDVRGVPFNMQMQKGKTLAGFVQRLKGKQGRFRGNLSGKRVEYTGRTVISPDPNLKISEVAIPIHMARILTYPERVSHHNIEKLRQCVRNGPDKYPGARLLRHAGGPSWSLIFSSRKRLADELRFGDIVDRHLEDGDIVLFNRQPSLHRMSIMCHRARVMPWRTLRFNESVCNPYNADFDGDEMNLHVPQTEEARTEAILLMGVQNNLCTPKNGEILVASTQDFLTSSYLITRKDTFYDRSTFSLICTYMGDGMDFVDLPTPAIIKPVELWSGKQLFSILLRPHANVRVYVNLTVKEKNYSKGLDDRKREFKTMCPNDGFVYFRNSELISGQLGKGTLVMISAANGTCLYTLGILVTTCIYKANISDSYSEDDPVLCQHTSSPLGNGAVVETTDNKILVLQRSNNVGEFPGHFVFPGGHPEPQEIGIASHQYDKELTESVNSEVSREMFDSIVREVVEEIGVPPSSLSIPAFIGVSRRDLNVRPAAFFFIKCSLDSKEVQQFYSSAEDGYESTQLYAVSMVDLQNMTSGMPGCHRGGFALYKSMVDTRKNIT